MSAPAGYTQLPSGFWVAPDGSGPYSVDVAAGTARAIGGVVFNTAAGVAAAKAANNPYAAGTVVIDSVSGQPIGTIDSDGDLSALAPSAIYPSFSDGSDITAALNALLAESPGRKIVLPAGNFTVSAPVSPPAGYLMSIQGAGSNGAVQRTQITTTHAGIAFMPATTGGYDLDGLVFIGPSTAGSTAIGSNAVGGSAGRAKLSNIYVSGYDIGIDFGDEFEHPLGIDYDRLYVQAFRTGGINIGGSGAASSGEGAWKIGSAITTNSSVTPTAIAPTVDVNTPDTTHDRLTWTGTAPRYGWLIIRSADGSTNWQVVPNLNSPLTATTFDALKVVSETWTYKVITCIVGMYLGRGKAVSALNLVAEYCGIGLLAQSITGLHVGALYSEQRSASVARATLAAVRANSSFVHVGTIWADEGAFAAVNSASTMRFGIVRCANLTRGAIGLLDGGSGCPTYADGVTITGAVTTKFVPMASGAIENTLGYYDYPSTQGVKHYVDGKEEAGYHVNRRGVEKGRFSLNSSGFTEIVAELPAFTVPAKALTPGHINLAHATTLTDAVATNVLSFDVPSNGSVGYVIPFVITVTYSGATRQVCTGILTVSGVSAAGTVAAAATVSGVAKALQAGTLTDPAATVSVASSTVTVLINTDTSGTTPTMTFKAIAAQAMGSAAPTITLA